MKKGIILGIMMGAMLTFSIPAAAEEVVGHAPAIITSADGIFAIQLPADDWKEAEDANHLLSLTDGNDVITVDLLSHSDTLPVSALADESYGAVYQALVSNRDKVFAVKGCAVKEEDLEDIMRAIGTIQILKPNADQTTAQQTKETEAAFGLRSIGAVYYITGDDVNVRTGCSMDDEVIGSLYKGEEVYVDGAVTTGGQDYGWYKIKYKDKEAYVSAKFATDQKPVAAQPSASSSSGSAPSSAPASAPAGGNIPTSNLAFCEYCGQWFEEGNIFRNHVCPARDAANAASSQFDDSSTAGKAQCPYCGEWYEEGNVFRNHICPARDAANAQDEASSTDGKVYCPYCGGWYEEGNIFRNHVCPARDEALAEEEDE